MSKSTNKRFLSTPKLPNISSPNNSKNYFYSYFNKVILVASARLLTTESHDPANMNRLSGYISPTHREVRGNSRLLTGHISPRTGLNLDKPRKSMPVAVSSDPLATFNGKMFQNSGKNFYLSSTATNFHKDENKLRAKLASLVKKRAEIASCKIWDSEQESALKKLLFFFQDVHTKFSDSGYLAGQQDEQLTQLVIQIENSVYNLLASVSFTVEETINENTIVKAKIADLQESLKNVEESSRIKYIAEYEKLERLKKEASQSLRNKEVSENSSYFAIQKLQIENDYLQEQLNNVLNLQNFEKINKELLSTKTDTKAKIEQYEADLKDRETMIARYEIMYNGTKKVNATLNNTIKELEGKLAQQENQYQEFQLSLEAVEEDRDMHRERGLMQLADYEALQLRYDSVYDYLEKMRDRYAAERQRAEKLISQYALHEKQEETNAFANELKTFESIKNITLMSQGKRVNLKKLDNDRDRSTQKVELKNYMLSKPSYASFFQKQMVYSKMNEPKFSVDFVGMLRAIYDSKYHELLYNQDTSQFSRFPDFVYSWMGKFVLDSYTRQIRTADIKDPDPEILRNEMILMFQSPLSSRLWECITFKEFLDEVHTRDELAYFLQCRYLLFKGPQLNDSAATFIYSYFVRFEWAEYVLELLLGDKYEKEAINLMRAKFRERAKLKNNILLLDSAFFLRVLLEDYKKEKANKIVLYRKELSEDLESIASHNGKLNISFDTVKEFLNTHFPETYDLEKAELYRKSWIISNGNVDADTVIMMLNEENFFSKAIKIPNLNDSLVTKEFQSNSTTELEKTQEFIVRKYIKIDKELDGVLDGVAKLGVEKLLVDHNEFEKRVRTHFRLEKRSFQTNDVNLSLQDFFIRVYKLHHITMQINNSEKKPKSKSQIEEIFQMFSKPIQEFSAAQDEEVKYFELNRKAKKLQKFFKSKLSSWYRLVSFILKNKLKKFYAEKGNSNGDKTVAPA